MCCSDNCILDIHGPSDELTLSLVPSLAGAEKDTTSDADISQGLQLLNRPVSLLQAFATTSDELARYRLVGLPLIEIDVVFQYSRRVLGVLFSLSLVSFVLETPAPDYRAGTPNVDVTAIFNRSSDTMWPLAWPVAIMALAMIWTIVAIVRAKVWARKSYLHVLETVPQPKSLREKRFLFCHNCACLQLMVALFYSSFFPCQSFWESFMDQVENRCCTLPKIVDQVMDGVSHWNKLRCHGTCGWKTVRKRRHKILHLPTTVSFDQRVRHRCACTETRRQEQFFLMCVVTLSPQL